MYNLNELKRLEKLATDPPWAASEHHAEEMTGNDWNFVAAIRNAAPAILAVLGRVPERYCLTCRHFTDCYKCPRLPDSVLEEPCVSHSIRGEKWEALP